MNITLILTGIIILLLIAIAVIIAVSRKKYRQTVVHMEKVAEESHQLQTAFLANMTHEIRTPLNGIIGFTNMLAEMDDLDRETRMEFMKEINDNKDALLKLVNDLLDYSKIETNTLEYKDEEVDVNVLISELCTKQQIRIANTKPDLVIEFAERLPQCRLVVDRTRFLQVLDNLVHNALKFTEKGSIKIGCRKQSTGNFYFYVADTGCGIDDSARQAVFQRFVKMNYNIKGSGLGLSITKSIVEHYGGGIGVESKKGEGSTFYFTLPARVEYKVYGKF